MVVGRQTRGAGVRKPPKEETAGGVTKLRVRRYGDLDAGGLLPRCVDRLSGKQSTGRQAVSAHRDRQNRRGAAEIERQDGCSGLREGEADHCRSGGSDTEGPRWGVAAN
jgi:hypothetical protein